MNIGMAGEVRFVVTKGDGSVKIDTGYQRNKILNQGLESIATGDQYGNIMSICLIGSGNSVPVNTQTQLDAFIAKNTTVASRETDYSYVDAGDNLYKTSATTAYRFTGMGNVNVAEVGLASKFTSSSNYTLCTRALIKDALGNPTTISVGADETLDVYYKVWQVFSTLDINNVVNMLDGAGGSVPYNTKARLYAVGSYNGRWNNIGSKLGHVSGGLNTASAAYTQTQDLVPITTDLGSAPKSALTSVIEPYVPGSYKQVMRCEAALNQANGSVIRSISLPTTMGTWQIRYGSVADDSPIPKTDKDTLSIPFEFSWGRYEGEL